MPDTEDSETGSLSEDPQKPRWSFLRDPTSEHWRFFAYAFGAASVLLLAGLATSLGVFLTKTECGAPPSLAQATTNYRGSAPPGSQVTYVCQHPLVFPDNSKTFSIRCNDNLRWDSTHVPSCGSRSERQCTVSEGDASLTLTTSNTLTSFEVQVTLRGPIPPSLVVDIPAGDETMCSYTNMTRASSASGAPPSRQWSGARDEVSFTSQEEEIHTVVVEDTTIDPRAPYEVRLRSVGAKVALSLLQGKYVKIFFASFSISSTTPSPRTTVHETKETESALTSTEAYPSTAAATAVDPSTAAATSVDPSTAAATAVDLSTAAPTRDAISSTTAAADIRASIGTTSAAKDSSTATDADEFTSILPERDPFITET
ncbi:uncharacterized protein [Panulirus ornatus]|uniref:uncharacterized protein n=1 Tax=Panulirus ornatus TaxID=150431 RepID=UPI003A879C9B